ncbi:MAG: aminopeptidase P family protein [Paracoccaceae bacterium]
MLQSFASTARPDQGPPRLAALRDRLAAEGLTGFLVPRADMHQGEYVAAHDERLQWLTGFTGSAGFCVVLPHIAGVFVDGRYRTQVKAQVDFAHFTPVPWPETKPGPWLVDQIPNGGVIGFDPWLHTRKEIDELEAALEGKPVTLRSTTNFIDAIWADQPPPPIGRAEVYSLAFAGETAADKRARLAAQLTSAGQTAAALTLPDSICWLLNIRGADVPRNPVLHATAILHADGRADLFATPAKLDAEIRAHLGPEVALHAPEDFASALVRLTGPVRVDKASAPFAVSAILAEADVKIAWGLDPCALPKARKNAAEIDGTAEAHLRDGAAMVEFLCWLDTRAPQGGLTEIEVVTALESHRRATNSLRDISFDTIAGSGPNGAIMHYRVTEESNRTLRDGELIVVDSGGQYLGGTTDITRTVAIGTPADEARAAFTRVLQGMIAISRLRWPRGLAGCHLDAIARYNLWLAEQDYDHGTGHGVGTYLSVHEGPQRLSRISDVPFEPGMILSNEPGYYREGEFGIRIENLVVVEEAAPLAGGDAQRKMLSFRTLTWVPIDRRLIDSSLLTGPERAWLDTYHAEVRRLIGPRIRPETAGWLEKATAPI